MQTGHGLLDRREIDILQQPTRLEVAGERGVGRVAKEVAGGVVAGHVASVSIVQFPIAMDESECQ